MTVENALTPAQLNPLWPPDNDPDHPPEEGAAHIRLLKRVMQTVSAGGSDPHGAIDVMDYATGGGVADDRAAIQSAIDAAAAAKTAVIFPAGEVFRCSGGLTLPDFVALIGKGAGIAQVDDASPSVAPKLIFDTATSGACLSSADDTTPLLYLAICGISIRCESAYDWVLDVTNTTEWVLENIRIVTVNNATGGFRSLRLSGFSSWVNRMANVQIRLPDAATARTVYTEWSDSRFTDCSFTGGTGALFSGAGACSYLGCRFDRAYGAAGAACVTIDNANTADYPHSHHFVGCEFEEADVGVLVYAESQDKPRCMPAISLCHFRIPNGTDIKLNNATGQVARGPILGLNNHTLTSARRLNWDPDRWQMAAPPVISWARKTANPISTVSGTTALTIMATIGILGRMVGIYGGIRIRSLWELSNDVYDKYLHTYIGLSQMAVLPVTADNQRTALMECEIWNQASPSSQVGQANGLAGPGSSGNPVLRATVNTDADFDITLRAQPFNTAATIKLLQYHVEIMQG